MLLKITTIKIVESQIRSNYNKTKLIKDSQSQNKNL
jgi:hypothetical protein